MSEDEEWDDETQIQMTERGQLVAHAVVVLFENGFSHLEIAEILGWVEEHGEEDAVMMIQVMMAVANETGALD